MRELLMSEVKLRVGDQEFVGTRTAVICGLIMCDVSKERREAVLGGKVPLNEDELKVLKRRGALKMVRQPREHRARTPCVVKPRFESGMTAERAMERLNKALAATAELYVGAWRDFLVEGHDEEDVMQSAAFDIAAGEVMCNPHLTSLYRKAHSLDEHSFGPELEEVLADYIYEALMAGYEKAARSA